MRAFRTCAVAVMAATSFIATGLLSGDVAQAQSPLITEYAGLADNSVPAAMALGPDGRIWYADLAHRVGAITTTGNLSEYPLPRASVDITTGPGNALWVAGAEEPVISRVTTSGVVTDFAMPATGAAPGGGIATGPDGNLWYTRSGVVGRMTPGGDFTEYTVPLPSPEFQSSPSAIVAGPDGALYFVERSDHGRIGRVTTDGEFTMYPGVGAGGDLRDIAVGPDNQIWVVNGGAGGPGDVGRLSNGTPTWTTLPSTDDATATTPTALTRGTDGNMWVAGRPSLWKVTTSGAVTKYDLGYHESATGIVSAEDRIWFSQPSDPAGPRIGALTLADHPYGEFTPLSPARVLDTRDGTGRDGVRTPIGSGASIDVQITGEGGVPADGVSAVVLNATATDSTAGGSYLTVWPTGAPRPQVSNLNFTAGQVIANMVTVAVGEDGKLSASNGAGSMHLVFDVIGYYSDASGPFGSRFRPTTPFRLFDTRQVGGRVPRAPIGPGGTLSVTVTGPAAVPSGATGVVMNLTVADSTRGGYVTAYPGDVTRPLASSLNFPAGRSVPNLVTVRVPESGTINFYNELGETNLLADVVGYYTTQITTNEGRFVPIAPVRLWDTRVDGGGQPMGSGVNQVLSVSLGGRGGMAHADVGAAVLNVTATAATDGSYLSVFSDDTCQIPNASNLNVGPGQSVPNQVITRLSPERLAVWCQQETMGVGFYNAWGNVHVIADAFGYFTSSRFADHSQPASTSALGTVFSEAQDILARGRAVQPDDHASVSARL